MKKRTTYNERAWAIDLISEINRLSAVRSRTIQRAGGEWGLSAQSVGSVLFPDVLSVEEELNSPDRMAFEKAVFESFGLLDVLPRVQESVLALHRIRGAACNQKASGKKS